MSLLDDVSIVVTPNGYKAGTLFGVIPVPTEGAEEVTNGDFTNGLTGFSTQIPSGQTVEVTSNQLHVDYDSTATQGSTGVNQTILTAGKQYKITIDVASITGTFRVQAGGQVQDINTSGIHTFYKTPTSSILYIIRQSNAASCEFRLNSVSVKEYTSADMDVTRETAATRVDENGLIEDVLSNVPRIDYTGGGCPHILAEPQRTNEITYSEDFSSWTVTQSSVTLTSNAAISPEGLQNATQIVFSDNTQTQLFQYIAAVSGTVYTTSTFIKYKSGTDRNIKIGVYDSEFKVIQLNFNTDGTIASTSTSGTLVDSGYEDYGNGWYRAYIVHTGATTGNIEVQFNRVGLSNTNEQFYIYGSQLEAGSYATSYIPTSGSTVTRNQDIFTRDGIGSLIGSEGVLFVEMAALSNDGTNRGISLNDGTATNRLLLYFSNSSNQIAVISTGFTGSIIYTLPDETLFNKIAVRYKANDVTLWVDGASRGTPITSATIPTFTAFKFDSGSAASPFYGKVKQLQVYDTALTDEQLLQLTGESGTDFYESYAEMASALTYTIQ